MPTSHMPGAGVYMDPNRRPLSSLATTTASPEELERLRLEAEQRDMRGWSVSEEERRLAAPGQMLRLPVPGQTPPAAPAPVLPPGISTVNVHDLTPGDPFAPQYPLFTAAPLADPTYDANKAAIGARLAALDARQPLTMTGATIAGAPQAEFRDQQMSLGQMLAQAAAGQGPSAAQAQLQRATDSNQAQALSLALSARGGGQFAALKGAQMQRALIGQDAAMQSADLRAREQQSAQAMLGQLLAQGRGADLNLATTQGQFDQMTGANNLAYGVQQQQQYDETLQRLLQTGMSLDQAQQQAAIQQAQFNAGLMNQGVGAAHGVALQQTQQGMQIGGAALSALGTIAAAVPSVSDERVKHDVRPADVPLAELLGAVGAHDYEYDDPDTPLRGRGRFVSPMAQEIEETQIGASMVRDTPDGKVVDYGKGLVAMLSGLGWVHRRIEKLEQSIGERLGGALASV